MGMKPRKQPTPRDECLAQLVHLLRGYDNRTGLGAMLELVIAYLQDGEGFCPDHIKAVLSESVDAMAVQDG